MSIVPCHQTFQSPVHGTCVWLCILRFGVQTGNDVRESGCGMMGMMSHMSSCVTSISKIPVNGSESHGWEHDFLEKSVGGCTSHDVLAQ